MANIQLSTATSSQLVQYNSHLTLALGKAANSTAAKFVFSDYTKRKASSTVSAQLSDLNNFCAYLSEVGQDSIGADSLQSDPLAWFGVSWGLVEGYKLWQEKKGAALGSLNRRLSTVKTYSKLAAKSLSTLPQDENVKEAMEQLRLVATVAGYSKKEQSNVNEEREVERTGHKKADSTIITPSQAKELMSQPDSPQGRRDSLLMALLLEHGMRASEVAALQVDGVDMKSKTIMFKRKKVRGTDKENATHEMTAPTYRAMKSYIENDAPSNGALLLGSRKNGELSAKGLRRDNLSKRVATLGAGIGKLSAHDCRHYCATQMARKGYGVAELCDWFGWNSPAMALRYIDAADVAKRDKG